MTDLSASPRRARDKRNKEMRRKRRTETMIETHQMWVVSRADKSPVICCASCVGASSLMVAPEEAAILVGVNARLVYRWVEAEMIHYLETSAAALLVCLDSVVLHASSGKFIHEGEKP